MLAAQPDYAGHIAPLIDPAKLSAVGPRRANPRVQRAVAWLAEARQAAHKPDRVLDAGLRSLGMKQAAADMTKAALLRSLDIADKLGCWTPRGWPEMRKAKAPTVRRGPYKGTSSAWTTSSSAPSAQNSTTWLQTWI